MAVPLPPLRERRERHPAADQPLHRHLQHRVPQEDPRRVTPAALTALTAYAWPGNVRELRNAVERAMLLADGNELNESALSDARRPPRPSCRRRWACRPAASISRRSSDRWWCRRSSAAAWNQTKAATLLGLNRDQIRYRIEKFELRKAVTLSDGLRPATAVNGHDRAAAGRARRPRSCRRAVRSGAWRWPCRGRCRAPWWS